MPICHKCGRFVRDVQGIDDASTQGVDEAYGYDGLDRLTSSNGP